MSVVLRPGLGVLYMKVGTHAAEPLEEIIKRKTQEIEEAGFAMWGYGGNSCHPRTMVQPFAQSFAQHDGKIYLCMQEMDSKNVAAQTRAEEWSADGFGWHKIPPQINVLGSRYALCIKDLHKEEFGLPLPATRVALGNSSGVIGSQYIRGRVDKACLEVIADQNEAAEIESVQISLVAELVDPYAVFLRNGPS